MIALVHNYQVAFEQCCSFIHSKQLVIFTSNKINTVAMYLHTMFIHSYMQLNCVRSLISVLVVLVFLSLDVAILIDHRYITALKVNY